MSTPIGTRLKDKVAIVTGSSSGIGRAIALLYASEGAYVVCSSRSPLPKGEQDYDGKSTHDAINSLYPVPEAGDGKAGVRAIFVKTDVSVAVEVENLVNECVRTFGRLDIMVNNAGIGLDLKRIHEMDERSWDSVMGINGKGTWLGCKHAIGQMLAQEPHPSGDRGWVINVTSVHGFVGSAGGATPYVASKGAMVTMTKALALEYANDRIHVNGLAPGYVFTPMARLHFDPNSSDPVLRGTYEELAKKHPFGSRLGSPEETARGALFLASDDAAFVTGHTLAVDGGYMAQ